MSFAKDLKIGEKAQIEFAKLLLSTRKVIKLEFAQGRFKDWDIKITTPLGEETYEIKFDTMAKDTGNFIIEKRCSGLASGIYTSKADYIVYNVKGEWRMQERGELILRLIKTDMRITKGGDGRRTEMCIIKCEELPNLFDKIEANETGKETGQNDGETE